MRPKRGGYTGFIHQRKNIVQIRERAHTLALIRTKYDKTKKRGVATCVGSVSKYQVKLTDEMMAILTDEEREVLEKRLRKTMYERDRVKREQNATMLPAIIDGVTRWYLDPTTTSLNLAGIARDTREAFSGLLDAMVRAGVGRKRKRRTQAELAKAAAAQKRAG
jgi:hypothetical protein